MMGRLIPFVRRPSREAPPGLDQLVPRYEIEEKLPLRTRLQIIIGLALATWLVIGVLWWSL